MHKTDHSFVLYTPLTREQVLDILQKETGGDSGQTLEGHPVYGELRKIHLEYAETHIKERSDGAEVRVILRLRPWLRGGFTFMRYFWLGGSLLTIIATELHRVSWHVTAAIFVGWLVYDIIEALIRRHRTRRTEDIRGTMETLLQCRTKKETTCMVTLP